VQDDVRRVLREARIQLVSAPVIRVIRSRSAFATRTTAKDTRSFGIVAADRRGDQHHRRRQSRILRKAKAGWSGSP